MFSTREKREIADKVQKALRETNHSELSNGEIEFTLQVQGTAAWSWVIIQNNSAITAPSINPWNERQDKSV